MRILFLTQYYPPEVGAPQVRLSALARELTRQGHKISVMTAMPNYPEGRIHDGYRRSLWKSENLDGVDVTRLALYAASGRGIARLISYLSFVVMASIGLFFQRRPDVVLIESPPLFIGIPGVFHARRWRCKSVFNVADLWPDAAVDLGALEGGMILRLALRLEAWCYRKSSMVTGATTGIIDELVNTKSVPEEKVALLPNGADTTMFSPEAGRRSVLEQMELPADGLFVFAGTQGFAQGLDNVITATQIAYPESGTPLALIGSGSVVSDLKALASKGQPGSVVFRDPVPPTDIAAVLPLVTAGIVSLIDLPTNRGARPSKIFPIMASGRPVLFCGTGEAAELILEADAGLVVPNDDPHAIAAAMIRLRQDPELCETLGRNGRKFVLENLSWPAIAERLLKDLERIP